MTTPDAEPSTLYHYTDARGLLGVVKPTWPYPMLDSEMKIGYHGAARLMASDVRFMNDTEELRFGARLLRQRMEAAAEDTTYTEANRREIAAIAPYCDATRIMELEQRCFATCFCADGDLLSQWRGYAGSTGGFAIGFDMNVLRDKTTVLHRHAMPGMYTSLVSAKLKPVLYGDTEGIASIDAHINSTFESEWASFVTHEREIVRQRIRFTLFTLLLESVTTVKAKGFAEEEEWRLFAMNQFDNPVDLRAGGRGLVPYLDFAVNIGSGLTGSERHEYYRLNPTIVDLVVGPGPAQAEQELAARDLLRSTGHDPTVVRVSEISYRG